MSTAVASYCFATLYESKRSSKRGQILVADEQVERNRELQRQLYGEPLGELFHRMCSVLELTQAKLAGVLGMSAPMLSQLITGQRAKIGNPAAVQRTQALMSLVGEVIENDLQPPEVDAKIDEIKGVSGVFSRTDLQAAGPGDPRASVRVVQGLFRAVASADELSRAARRLDAEFPGLAEVLRVYGTGRTDEAQAHFERMRHLI
jgi:DNA-binding transcriptional regulator YdaS (Cro superfamily)